ncbi:hypothetical protein D3C77_447970 [compost metagenome]
MRHAAQTHRQGRAPRKTRVLWLVQPPLRKPQQWLPALGDPGPQAQRPLPDGVPGAGGGPGLRLQPVALLVPAHRRPGLHHHRHPAAARRQPGAYRSGGGADRGAQRHRTRGWQQHADSRLQLLRQRPERGAGLYHAQGLVRARCRRQRPVDCRPRQCGLQPAQGRRCLFRAATTGGRPGYLQRFRVPPAGPWRPRPCGADGGTRPAAGQCRKEPGAGQRA